MNDNIFEKPSQERRRHKRIPIERTVEIEYSNSSISGVLVNLSESGALLDINSIVDGLRISDIIKIKSIAYQRLGNIELEGNGKVVWSRKKTVMHSIGIEFLSRDPILRALSLDDDSGFTTTAIRFPES